MGPGDSVAERLSAFVGEWSVGADFPGAEPMDMTGTVTFEPLEGGAFVVQRWEVPDPAPSGIAGAWEKTGHGGEWEHDFALTYTKRT